MGILDKSVLPAAKFVVERNTVTLVTAVSQAAVVAWKYTPGFRFQVVRVSSYCLLKAGVVTATVKVGGRTAATVAFTSATELINALSGVLANVRGLATEAITIEYTTDGSGVLTNGSISLEIRPFPLNGEAAIGP